MRAMGIFLLPRPQRSELAELYPAAYEPFQPPVDDEPSFLQRWLRRRHYRLRARLLHCACPNGGVLLDMGCATGNFVREVCRNTGWRGVGFDLSTRALTVAHSQGIAVWCGEATSIALPDAVCDAVTLWEVIEHVPDPQATLAEVRRVLRPGGTLLLSTPNGASWQARNWGRHWAGWDPPRHLHVFSFPILQQLLHASGLHITQRHALPLERFYLVDSIRRWLRYKQALSKETECVAVLLGLAAWPLLWLLDRVWPAASAIVLEARSEE